MKKQKQHLNNLESTMKTKKTTFASIILHMFDGFLREKLLWFFSGHAGLERWRDDPVEEEGSVDEKSETEQLQEGEFLPAETEGNDPNDECSRGIDDRTGSGRNGPGDGDSKEIESPVCR